jgi:hypothetical protein
VGLLLRPILLAGSSIFGSIGAEDCIPTQRFEAAQKNKVRGCDSATIPT